MAEFNELGATVVRGLFTPDEVGMIRVGIEKNLASPGPMFKIASQPDDPGRFVEDFCNWNRIDEFRTIAFSPGPLTSHSNLWAVRACASFMTTC